jgi:hypothetical protein
VQELASSEAEKMLMIVSADGSEGVQEDQVAGSEAAAPDAVTGIPDSPHSHTVIDIESDLTQSSSSSTDSDDRPLGQIYKIKHIKPKTKTFKKPSQTIPFEPMIPSVDERIGEMSEMRNKVYERLPLNHPLQP